MSENYLVDKQKSWKITWSIRKNVRNLPKMYKIVRIHFMELKCLVIPRKWYFSNLFNWTRWISWAFEHFKILHPFLMFLRIGQFFDIFHSQNKKSRIFKISSDIFTGNQKIDANVIPVTRTIISNYSKLKIYS